MLTLRWTVLAVAFAGAAWIVFAGSKNDPGSGWLLVANKGDQSLGIVDPESRKQVAEVPEGGITGHEVIASPDGRTAYVPIYGNSGVGKPGTDGTRIVAIDLASRKIVATLDFDHGIRPHCPLFNPRDGMLYVTTELDQTISVIDPKTFKVTATVPTGQPESHMFIISRDGRFGYTANVGPGTVSVLDLVGRRTLAVIPISKNTQRISLSADDKLVFTADQTQPRLAVIDAAQRKIKTWITLPATAYGTATTSDGRWLVAAVPGTNQAAVVDLQTMKVAHLIDVPSIPQEVLIRPDQRVAYVSCNKSGKVAVIDIAQWKLDGSIDAGKDADGLAWAPRS